jgi:Uma2 family endonuclease
MAVTTQKLTFEEYLTYEDGTDTRYELVDGELVAMSLGTGQHGMIIDFLTSQFKAAIDQMKQPWVAMHSVIGVRSPRGRRWDTSRIPDITILPLTQLDAMSERVAVIDLTEPPPLLVVEIVSPSTQSDDYRSKRTEYGALEIPEYWIVDPLSQQVTLCILENRLYDSLVFQNDEPIESPTLPSFNLTAAQVFARKR